MRLLLEQAGGQEKMALEMISSDSMAELRAEVTQWWKVIHANSDPHPPFRILAHGKEIGTCCFSIVVVILVVLLLFLVLLLLQYCCYL